MASASSTSERNQRGVNRILNKLNHSIETGNYYEAHQMYRTLYFRYTTQGKYEECLDLLHDGARDFISKHQETTAADLGQLIIDTLERRGGTADMELWINRLNDIIYQLSAIVERETLVNRALKWSGRVSGITLGHPSIHTNFAEVLLFEGCIEQARYHYLLSRNGLLFGQVLVDLSEEKGFSGEVDMFITQAVLQILCLKEVAAPIQMATSTFRAYTLLHLQIRKTDPPFKMPLLNFVYFLLRSIEMESLETFQTLCDLYKPSLSRDASFEKHIGKIGTIYFGIQAPSNQNRGVMGGIFGNFLSTLLQDFEENDEVDDQNNMAVASNYSADQSNELD